MSQLYKSLGPRPRLTFIIADEHIAQIWVNGRAPRISIRDYDWGPTDPRARRDRDGYPYTKIHWTGPAWALGLSLRSPK